MKKLAMVIMMIIMVCVSVVANADAYDNYRKMVDYIYNTFDNNFTGVIDDVYLDYGYLDVDEYIAHGELDSAFKDEDPIVWFEDWYNTEVKKYIDYTIISTNFELYDVYEGINIYVLTVISNEDVTDYYEGIQDKMIMLVTIG